MKATYPYLRCRAIAHTWQNHNPLRPVRSSGVVLSLRCTNCGMLREDTISRVTGNLVSRGYVQPKRYKNTKTSRDEYRKSYILAINGRGSR